MRRYSGSTGRSAQGGFCFLGGRQIELRIRRNFERSLTSNLSGLDREILFFGVYLLLSYLFTSDNLRILQPPLVVPALFLSG